jgi:hypothetical protein
MKEIKNFAVIDGKATITSNSIAFKELIDKKDESKSILSTEVRTDSSFSNGTIEFKAKFSTHDSGCVVVLKRSSGELCIAGCSKNRQKFLIPDKEDYSLKSGLINYDIKKPLLFRIEVNGSNIFLYVNNILITQGECSLAEAPLGFRLSGSETILSDIKFEPIKPNIFVIMQFTKDYNELYNDVIKPVCESFNLECIRADEFFTSSPIIKDIIESIKGSYIIIAEITPDNPNVFYEIGYAHAINKPTILLCDKKREKLPFDVSGFRTLFYENSIGGKTKVERDLKKFIDNILK